MSEIEIKKKLKIRIVGGHILSYKSIEKVFNDVFKCNMFNSDIEIHMGGKDYLPEFYMKLNCSINKYESADLLLNEMPKYFDVYSITKSDKEKHIYFESTSFKNPHLFKTKKMCEPLNESYDNLENWFSVFIDEKELPLDLIVLTLKNLNPDDIIDKIKHVQINNFKSFVFDCSNSQQYKLEYEDLEKSLSEQPE
jgi:hypothetical protein